MIINRSLIDSFRGSWGSGLACLVFQDGRHIYADNGPLARTLDEMTMQVAIDAGQDPYQHRTVTPNHTINQAAIQGLDVLWWEDELGLCLGGLALYGHWLQNGMPEIELGGSYELETEEL